MSAEKGSIDDFLASVDPERSDDTKKIIQVIRNQYPQAKESVKWGMAMFEINGTFVTGVSATKDFNIFIPHSGLVKKYLSRLGKVSHERSSFRFTKLEDLNIQEFEHLLNEIRDRIFSRNQ